jgi:hypothetical protein
MPTSGFDNQSNVLDNVGSQFSGIFSTRPTAKYASGARTILKINGRIVGFAFGVSWRIDTTVIEINTIDDDMPYELAPQRINVSGTLSALHIPGQGPGAQLWQPDILNFLSQEYISIEVRDTNDQLLFFTNKAMIISRQEDIRIDALASIQLQWKAIGYKDERNPEVGKDKQAAKKDDRLNPISRLQDTVTNSIANVAKKFGLG